MYPISQNIYKHNLENIFFYKSTSSTPITEQVQLDQGDTAGSSLLDSSKIMKEYQNFWKENKSKIKQKRTKLENFIGNSQSYKLLFPGIGSSLSQSELKKENNLKTLSDQSMKISLLDSSKKDIQNIEYTLRADKIPSMQEERVHQVIQNIIFAIRLSNLEDKVQISRLDQNEYCFTINTPFSFVLSKFADTRRLIRLLSQSGCQSIESPPSLLSIEKTPITDHSSDSVSQSELSDPIKPSLISRIIKVWSQYTGLSYLTNKLENRSQDHKVRLHTYTFGLLFKESDSTIKKIMKVVPIFFGIAHVASITTLLVDIVFPGQKKAIV